MWPLLHPPHVIPDSKRRHFASLIFSSTASSSSLPLTFLSFPASFVGQQPAGESEPGPASAYSDDQQPLNLDPLFDKKASGEAKCRCGKDIWGLGKTLLGPLFRDGAGSKGAWGGSSPRREAGLPPRPSMSDHVLPALAGCWDHRVDRELPASP